MSTKTFEEWKREVDEIIHMLTGGLISEDLPDWNYQEAYDAGVIAEDAAREVLNDGGWSAESL